MTSIVFNLHVFESDQISLVADVNTVSISVYTFNNG